MTDSRKKRGIEFNGFIHMQVIQHLPNIDQMFCGHTQCGTNVSQENRIGDGKTKIVAVGHFPFKRPPPWLGDKENFRL